MAIANIMDHSTYTSVHRQEYSTKCYCWYCQLKLDYVCTSLQLNLSFFCFVFFLIHEGLKQIFVEFIVLPTHACIYDAGIGEVTDCNFGDFS